MTKKYVYFIQSGGDGPIKIGCSVDFIQRMNSLKYWSPYPLKILATARGGLGDERAIHNKFLSIRLHGEWFAPTKELIKFIDNITATGKLPKAVIKRQKDLKFSRYIMAKNITGQMAAEELGVSPSLISRLCKGSRKPSAALALKIYKWSKGSVKFEDFFKDAA